MTKQHYSLGLFPLGVNHYRIGYWGFWAHYLNPKNYWRTVKYFCQRGYRGYADCDHWDCDSYIESVMLGVIKDLSKDPMGYPSSLIIDMDENGNPTEDDKGSERWEEILREIVEGLEASRELALEDTVPDAVYPNSHIPMKFKEVEGSKGELFEIDRPKDLIYFDSDLFNQWQAPLKKKKKRAMLLLVKHWGSFWD